MKKAIGVLIIICIISLSFLIAIGFLTKEHKPYKEKLKLVEQYIDTTHVHHLHCKDLVTTVWYNKEIIKAWYDPIETVNSDLVKKRQMQGDSLIHALDLMR